MSNISQWKVGDVLSASKLNAMVDAINDLLASQTGNGDVYITLDELNDILEQYSDIGHTHSVSEIVDLVLPTKLSQLQNDTSYATEDYVSNAIANAQLGGDGEVDLSAYATKDYVDTKIEKIELTPGPQGEQGERGEDGLTTSITVNGSTFVHQNGVITLPDYPLNGKQFSEPMTKAEYDAITDKDENTIYLVEDEEENVIIGLPDYTTNDANKILAVNAQGTALAWVDKPEGGSGSVDLTGYAKTSDIPTKTSQLTNDSDFVNKSYVAAEISNVSVGGGAVFREPALREVFSCTVPDNFSDCTNISIFSGSTTTGASIRMKTNIVKCPNTPEVITITTNNNMRSNKSELIFTRRNYYEPQYFIVTPLAPGEGTVTVSAPTGFTNTATFTITGEAIEDVEPDEVTLLSINAVYTQGSTVVYPDTSLDTLKTDLIVTANYSDGSNQTVTDYSLDGTLAVGTSTVTVTFEGKTTTFNVVVTAEEEEPDTPSVVEGEYATNGLTHMVDFTQYAVGHTGDIVDTVTNEPLVTNGLSSYTTGRIGFVEEGMFSPGPNRTTDTAVWAYIPESTMGQLVYPVTIEAYVCLRQNYNAYSTDGVKEMVTDRLDADIFSTRDTSTADNGVNGFWLRYLQSTNNFAIIEILNNTNIQSSEGSATDLYAYTTEDMVWTHFVVVFGPEDKRLYINGELAISGDGGTLTPNAPCYFKFSRYDWKMFRMYNRSLTAEEVQNNYNVTITTMGGNQ